MGSAVSKQCCGGSGESPTRSDGSSAKSKSSKASGTSSRLLTWRSAFNACRGKRKREEFSMPKAERTIKAAMLIQQWYRRYLARVEVRRMYTWTIFQSIEYAGEQDQMQLYNFFNALLTYMPQAKAEKAISKNPEDEKLEKGSKLASVNIDSSYKGPHLSPNVSDKDVSELIEAFKNKKRLHAKYLGLLLKDSTAVLQKMQNFHEVSTAISKQVTIVGDLHGSLEDLLVIFHKNGLPSTENPYIFNGDFVDRGKRSVEVLVLLLSCMLAFPGSVFLNRGNHEDTVVNARYGFLHEVREKYKEFAEEIVELLENLFRWLPLGAIVDSKTFIVHGGISDSTDIYLLKSLDRKKYVSLLRPPVKDTEATNDDVTDVIDKLEWKQVFDLLWSDPQGVEGCVPNTLRGAGTYFGPDITDVFLQKYNLTLLVRSHECKPEGFEIIHSGKCITIFSASNYYEVGSNKGSYLKLVGPRHATHFVQYMAVVSQTRRLTIGQRVGIVETSALRDLNTKIHSCHKELMEEFHKFDAEKTGYISLLEWCTAMQNGTGLNIPWRMLREKIVAQDSNTGMIEYQTTFQEKARSRSASFGTATVVQTLYRNRSNLEAIFRIIDKDHSGYISMDELAEACDLLSKHLNEPISREHMVDIAKSMDMNKDGLIDLNEFLETFRLVNMTNEEIEDI